MAPPHPAAGQLRARRKAVAHRFVALGLATSLAACFGPVSVKTRSFPESRPEPVRPNELTEPSRALLRRLDLDDRLSRDGAPAVVAILNGFGRLRPERSDLLAAQAELSFLEALRLDGIEAEGAAGWHLQAAAEAWDYLLSARDRPFDAAFDPLFPATAEIYRRSLAAWIHHQSLVGFEDHLQPTFLGDVRVRLATGDGFVDPRPLDEILVARELELRGLSARYRRPGLGTELVLYRANPKKAPEDRFFPPEGIVAPATAILRFEDPGESPGTREAVLEIYDPRDTEALVAAGRQMPLAADFTAPYGVLLSRSDFARVARKGLTSPGDVAQRQGLFLLQPYDPQKIPLIMVHGLRSSPLSWIDLTNDLLGDDTLRSRFQIWHYNYPTGLPFLYSGAVLADTVEELCRTFDPEGDDPATSSIVFIAHSMGGMVTRTLVTDAGSRLWDAAFRVPLDSLTVSDEDREVLRKTFFPRPRPWVGRVIFVAVPQTGVPQAGHTLGKILSSLVDLPEELTDRLRTLVRHNPGAATPEMEPILARGGPNAVNSLDPENPLMKVFIDLPVAPGIPFHTLAGDRGRPDVAEPTDGYVPVAATRLAGARSVRVVPSGHGVHSHPLGIAEIRRILREHLAELDTPRPPS